MRKICRREQRRIQSIVSIDGRCLGGGVSGNVDLGDGDDAFFYTPPTNYFSSDIPSDESGTLLAYDSVPTGGEDRVTGSVDGGAGIDAAGYYVKGTAEGEISLLGGFENAAVYVDGTSSKFTLTGKTGGGAFPGLAIYGDGTVVNEASIDSSQLEGMLAYGDEEIAVRVKGNGARFDNIGDISGFVGIELQGNDQVVTNRADLTRGSRSGDSTGNTGFIIDSGLNNTIVNEGSIAASAFYVSSIYLSDVSHYVHPTEFAEIIAAGDDLPVSHIVNKGTLTSGYGGIRTETPYSVDITNSGTINIIRGNIKYGDLGITNESGGEIAYTEIALPLYIQDKPKDPVHEVSINIANETGGQMDRVWVHSVYYAAVRTDYITELDIVTHISNAEGATIGGSGYPIKVDLQRSDFFSNDRVTFRQSALLDNAGMITGGVDFGDGADVINNSGTIQANVTMGAGQDLFTQLIGGTVAGYVDGGADTDTVLIEADAGTDILASEIAVKYQNFENFGILGDGNLVLDANPGIPVPTFTAGRVQVNDTYSGDISIGEMARLGGNGTINGNVSAGGTVAAGNSIGTLHISGNLTMSSSSTLEVEFNKDATDLVVVGGSADLQGGTIKFVPYGDNVFGVFSHEVLRADGGITGSFNTILVPNYALVDLRYEGNSLFADIITQIGAGVDLSPQSAVVANYINGRVVAGASASTLDLFTTLAQLDPATELNGALSELHPEAYAATAGISLSQGLAIADALSDIAFHSTVQQHGIHLWTAGLGDFTKQDGSSSLGTSNVKTNNYGILAGVDYATSSTFSVGGFLGYSDFNQNFSTLAARTEGNNTIFGGYLSLKHGRLGLGAVAAYGNGDAKTKRNLASLDAVASSKYGLNTFTAYGEVEYQLLETKGISIRPQAKLTYISSDRDVVQESGADGADLVVNSDRTDFLCSDLATRFEGRVADKILANLTVGWRYNLNSDPYAVTAHFVDETGAFSVAGAGITRSRFVLGTGISAELSPNLLIFARYGGQFGSGVTNQSARIGVQAGF